MMLAGVLEIEMRSSITRLAKDMHEAQRVVGGAMKNVESAVASAKNALGALGLGLGAGYFVSLTKAAIDTADEINDLSQSMGIAVQELGKYKLATEQSGSALQGMARGIKGLATAFAEYGDELRGAGITATDTDGKMRQIAEMFASMPDGIEKTTLAVKLFGKSGMELIPMLNMGAAGLAETAEKSGQYAAVLATMAPQADKFNDTMAELGMASKVASLSMINDALPALQDITAAMVVAAHEGGALKTILVGLGGVVSEFIAKPLGVIFKGIGNDLDEMVLRLQKFLGASQQLIDERAGWIAQRWKEISDLTTPSAEVAAAKTFDTEKWVAQYKKMLAALGVEGKKSNNTASKELQKLIDLNTKGEIDALIAREKAWSDEQKAINDLRNAGFEEDKRLIDLGAKGVEDAALARVAAVQGEMEAINAARNAEFEADKLRQEALLREQKRNADEIDRLLGDAIMRGFEAGKGWAKNFWESMINMAKTVVLRPIISAVMSPVTGAITSTLGGMGLSGGANAAGSAVSSGLVGSVGGWFGSAAAGGVPVTSTIGAVASGAGYAGAGSTGMMGTLAAIPGWGWAALGAAAIAAYLLSGDEDAQRTGNWTGALGQAGRSSQNKWFDASTGGGTFAAELAAQEQQIVGLLNLSAGQTSAINAALGGLSGKQYGFGLEHTDWMQSGAPQAIAADRLRVIAESLGMSVEAMAQKIADAQKVIDLSPQKLQLEIDLMKLQGKGTEALAAERKRELEAMDPTLHALAQQIYAAQDAAEATQALAQREAAVADERIRLQGELDQLTMTAAEYLNKQRQALDASNQAIFDQIQAATAQKQAEQAAAEAAARAEQEALARAVAVANERKNLQDQLDKLTLTSAELLAKQRDALDESNRALFDQVQAATEAAAAVTAANAVLQEQAKVAAERYGLETRLLEVQGNTAALRARELKLLDTSNKALQGQIWALQDKIAADALFAQSVEDEMRAAAESADAQLRAAEQIKNAWLSVTEALVQEVNRIRGLSGATPQSLAAAQAQFAVLTAQARAGDVDAAKMLPGMSQSILGMVSDRATSSLDVARARGRIAASLDTTADIAAGLQDLRNELAGMRRDTRTTAEILTRVTQDGNSLLTTAA